jgi:hypothetical protein
MSTLSYPPIPTLSPELLRSTVYAPRIPIRPRKPKALAAEQQAPNYFTAIQCLRQRAQKLMMLAAETSCQDDTDNFRQLTEEARSLGLAAIWLSSCSEPAQANSDHPLFN